MNKTVLVIGIIFLLIGVSVVSSRNIINYNMENHPPNIPKVAGEIRPKVGVEYEYAIWTTDPDGDDVSYYIDWGDGNITGWTVPLGSGIPFKVLHAWYESGTYLFRCKAKDHPYEAESDWYEFYIIVPPKDKAKTNSIMENHPPYAPNIEGPRFVKRWTTYRWTFKAIDPDGDNVSYIIDWGDGTFEGWTEWYPSGEEITRYHAYEYYMSVMIRAKAKDIHGAEGPVGTLPIEVSLRIKMFNPIFFRLLEQYPNAFPILRYILRANL